MLFGWRQPLFLGWSVVWYSKERLQRRLWTYQSQKNTFDSCCAKNRSHSPIFLKIIVILVRLRKNYWWSSWPFRLRAASSVSSTAVTHMIWSWIRHLAKINIFLRQPNKGAKTWWEFWDGVIGSTLTFNQSTTTMKKTLTSIISR